MLAVHEEQAIVVLCKKFPSPRSQNTPSYLSLLAGSVAYKQSNESSSN